MVLQIVHRINKYMKCESGSDDRGLIIKKVRKNAHGDAMRDILNGKSVSGWSVVEVDDENVQTKKRKEIQNMVKQSTADGGHCVIKMVRGVHPRNPPTIQSIDTLPIAQSLSVGSHSKSSSNKEDVIESAVCSRSWRHVYKLVHFVA